MTQRLYVPRRGEGETIPQGVSVTETLSRIHIYLRSGDEIATIKLPKPNWEWEWSGFGGMRYEVIHREGEP